MSAQERSFKIRREIENIIEAYCEGIWHLEFSRGDLPSMSADIISYMNKSMETEK